MTGLWALVVLGAWMGSWSGVEGARTEPTEVKIIKGCAKGRSGVFSDALNCTRYIQCPRFGSKPIPFACFPGFVYNPCQKACTWDPQQRCVPVQSCAQKVGYLFLPSSLENRVGNLIAAPPALGAEEEAQEDESVFAMPDDEIRIVKESIDVPADMAPSLMKKELVKEDEAIRLRSQASKNPNNSTTLEIYIVRVVFGPQHKNQLKLDLPDLQRHLRQQIDRASAALSQAAQTEQAALPPVVDIDVEQRPFLPEAGAGGPQFPELSQEGPDAFEEDEHSLPALKKVEEEALGADPALELPSTDPEDEIVEHVINLPDEEGDAVKDEGLFEEEELSPGEALLEAPLPGETPPAERPEPTTAPSAAAPEDASLPTEASTLPSTQAPTESPKASTEAPADIAFIDASLEAEEPKEDEEPKFADLPEEAAGTDASSESTAAPASTTASPATSTEASAASTEAPAEPLIDPAVEILDAEAAPAELPEKLSTEAPVPLGTSAAAVSAVSIETGEEEEAESAEEELAVAALGEELSVGQTKALEASVDEAGEVEVRVSGAVDEVCGIPGLASQAVCSCASPSQRAQLGLSDPALLSAYCATLKCLNGGMFIWNFGECGCMCKAGFRGIGCEDAVEAEAEPCGGCANQGKCVPLKDGAEACQCPIGFIGAHCQYSVEAQVEASDADTQAIAKTGAAINTRYSSAQLSLRLAVGEGQRCLNGGLSFLQPRSGERSCFCTANYAGPNCAHFCEECAREDSILGRF